MIDLVRRGDDWWPAADVHCREAVLSQLLDVPKVVAMCERKRTVVQAGANVGLFPKALARHFDRVVCFEPHIPNALCAEMNLKGSGVELWLAALGETQRQVTPRLVEGEGNCGAVQMQSGGMTPVLTIDSLGLDDCDLIWLDIEGDEALAIMGADGTLRRCSPLVVLEEKGLGQRYGHPAAWTRHLLEARGYRQIGEMQNDIILRKAA